MFICGEQKNFYLDFLHDKFIWAVTLCDADWTISHRGSRDQ